MATTKKHGRAGRRTSTRRAAKRPATRRAGARPSSRKPESKDAREEAEVSGEILGAGQGGPGRMDDPEDEASQHDEHTRSRHHEGLSGSEGLGSDDQVIDSSFSLSGRKYHGRRHEADAGTSRGEDEGESDLDDRYGQEGGRGMAPGAGA